METQRSQILASILLFFSLLSFIQEASANPNVYLRPGQVVLIPQSITDTRVFCGGNGNGGGNGGGHLDCVEECQQWYNVTTEVNGHWEQVPTCAFQKTCEMLSNGCVRATTCSSFQSKIVETNGHWQTILVCLGTKSKISCP